MAAIVRNDKEGAHKGRRYGRFRHSVGARANAFDIARRLHRHQVIAAR